MVQAMGGILDTKWAHDGIVTSGHYCTAQGIIQQTGELGVALITFIITIHALLVATLSTQQSERVARIARPFAFGVVALASLFIALWVAMGNHKYRNYETPTPYWCWISPEYSRERIAGDYVWMWIALLASTIVYIPLYFWARGQSQLRAALRMLL
jgi:cytochrome bd-type quinol oxidase subunit 2